MSSEMVEVHKAAFEPPRLYAACLDRFYSYNLTASSEVSKYRITEISLEVETSDFDNIVFVAIHAGVLKVNLC